jgi:signal recognition particle GTPase
MVRELVTLVVVLSVVGLFIWILRRAGDQSRTRSSKSVQERVVGAAAPERAPRERKRKRKAAPAGKRPPTPAPEEEEEEDDDADADADTAAAAAAPADDEATSAFKAGLAKTRGGFVAKLGKLFAKKQIDADVLPALEEVLFTADIGPRAADRIFESVKKGLGKDELADPAKIWAKIRATSTAILDVGAPPVDWSAKKPFVLLVLGVNGVGKTTTIGKLAALMAGQGKRVVLGPATPSAPPPPSSSRCGASAPAVRWCAARRAATRRRSSSRPSSAGSTRAPTWSSATPPAACTPRPT